MLKKFLKGLVVAGALMGLVAPAQAAIDETSAVTVNMFGASAQYNYWSTFTPTFMIGTAVGCPAADVYHAEGNPTLPSGAAGDRDNYIAICLDNGTIATSTNATQGTTSGGSTVYNENVIIRYTTFNSAKGFQAAIENLDDPDSCGDADQSERYMADVNNSTFELASFDANGCAVGAIGTVDGLVCTEVNVGCGDTGPECFTQSTEGPTYWDVYPDAGDGWYKMGSFLRWFQKEAAYWYTASPPDFTGFTTLTQKSPFVVTFAFFLNDNEAHGRALRSYTNDFGIHYMNNLSRAQAGLLFSGKVAKWSLFLDDDDQPGVNGNTYDDNVMLCIRHAGSGTHATTDYAVLDPFYSFVSAAAHPGFPPVLSGSQPAVMTNKGSSDEIECVAMNGGLDDTAHYTAATHIYTAIGYADWDKLVDTEDADTYANLSTGDCENLATWGQDADYTSGYSNNKNPRVGNAARLCYTGFEGNAQDVIHCRYDYWGGQICIYPEDENPTGDLFGAVMAFAATPSASQPQCGATPVPTNDLRCDREKCDSPLRTNPNFGN